MFLKNQPESCIVIYLCFIPLGSSGFVTKYDLFHIYPQLSSTDRTAL